MKIRAEHRRATMRFATILRMVAAMVAPVWMLPALLFNIDWAAGWLAPWNLAAAFMIVGSAVLIDTSRKAERIGTRFSYLLAGCFLILVNVQTAFTNASHQSDHRS